MHVDIHGGASVGVTEALLSELHARSAIREDAGKQMAQAVQAEAPDLGSVLRRVQNVVERVRVQRAS